MYIINILIININSLLSTLSFIVCVRILPSRLCMCVVNVLWYRWLYRSRIHTSMRCNLRLYADGYDVHCENYLLQTIVNWMEDIGI